MIALYNIHIVGCVMWLELNMYILVHINQGIYLLC